LACHDEILRRARHPADLCRRAEQIEPAHRHQSAPSRCNLVPWCSRVRALRPPRPLAPPGVFSN
jgi:hypothetical protein